MGLIKILVSAGPIEVSMDDYGRIGIIQSNGQDDDDVVLLSPGDARLVIAAIRKLLVLR